MRVSTDDERFGFIITRLDGLHMFSFQLIISGQLIGDSDPCILGSAMHQLGNLPTFDDARLAGLASDPASAIPLLHTDESLHDGSTVTGSESLDRWSVNMFIHEGCVVLLAQAYCDDDEEGPSGELLTAFVDVAEYDLMFKVVCDYWSATRTAVL